jgi:dTDP-4-amino-4,6-dideoxygalactose transaminase
MNKRGKINVTQPSLPPLDEFVKSLELIWDSRWLTNKGPFHERFERELENFLDVEHVSLFSNGTLALIVALQALRITGEVITTPYSFVATTHALHWNGITPVFCDIDPDTFNIDPARIEAHITQKTTAILPVHVYGRPCDCDAIEQLAETYGLRVIYDAAHAFGVRLNGRSILERGDASILSFHATKPFNTIEGGAIVSRESKLKQRVDFLKNFGFASETQVVAPGINAKMNELQAAYGSLQLKYVQENTRRRKAIAERYESALAGIKGLRTFPVPPNVQYNYPYFPILINEREYGRSRNEVFDELKRNDIYARRYFFPLISQFSMYRDLPSASPSNLPFSEKAAREILCLPIFDELPFEVVDEIVRHIDFRGTRDK